MSGDLIDVRQAAQEIGRSAETVRRWVWAGRLPAQRQGRRLMVDRQQLYGVVQDQRTLASGSLADWVAELEKDPMYADAPRRASASDIVLEDRRDRVPGGFKSASR